MKVNKLNNRILFVSPSVQAGWQSQSHITDFKLDKKLGSGSFGTVHRAVHKKTNKVYAIKQIKKSDLDSKKLLQHATKQVQIMYKLNHPSIIKLYNHFEDQIYIYLILQYAANGQLYTYLKSQPDKKFSQKIASEYIRQITQGIRQIHSKKIMHRDLKLQNILVDDNKNMKIADFGWSQFVEPEKRTTFCGTLDYLAPEMIQRGHKHDQRVDIWSIGVLIYQLCVGASPFSCNLTGNDINIENVKRNIKNVIYQIPRSVTPQCNNIIKSILKKDPEQRLSIQKILNHVWIGNNIQKNNKLDNWMETLKKQMKQMFPQQTVVINQNANNFFTKQQIYQYTRPDSIINLKSKKKKQQLIQPPTPIKQQKPLSLTATTSGLFNPAQFPPQLSVFELKKLSQLQLKVTQLQVQHKKDQQQIGKLHQQLIQSRNRINQHKQCKNQIKQLMQQILQQNKTMQQLNWKLIQSQKKILQLQKNRNK